MICLKANPVQVIMLVRIIANKHYFQRKFKIMSVFIPILMPLVMNFDLKQTNKQQWCQKVNLNNIFFPRNLQPQDIIAAFIPCGAKPTLSVPPSHVSVEQINKRILISFIKYVCSVPAQRLDIVTHWKIHSEEKKVF